MHVSNRNTLRLQLIGIISLLTICTIILTNRSRANVPTSLEFRRKSVIVDYKFADVNLQNANKIRMQWANPPAIDGEYYLPAIPTRYQIPIILQELQVRTLVRISFLFCAVARWTRTRCSNGRF